MKGTICILHSINKSHHLFDMVLITLVYVASCMKMSDTYLVCHKHGMMKIRALSLGTHSNPSADCLSFSQVCLQKQSLESDLEDVRGKLKNTESDLKESQKRETQTEAKLTVQQHTYHTDLTESVNTSAGLVVLPFRSLSVREIFFKEISTCIQQGCIYLIPGLQSKDIYNVTKSFCF